MYVRCMKLKINRKESRPPHISARSWGPILNYILDKLRHVLGHLTGRRSCVWRDVAHWVSMLRKELGIAADAADVWAMIDYVHEKLG